MAYVENVVDELLDVPGASGELDAVQSKIADARRITRYVELKYRDKGVEALGLKPEKAEKFFALLRRAEDDLDSLVQMLGH